MKQSIKLLLVMLVSFISVSVYSAQSLQEVVYLKDGSIISGDIIEMVPNTSLKIKTADGSVFAHKMEDVVKITKEAPYNAVSSTQEESPRSYGAAYGWEKAPRYRGFFGESYIFHTGDIDEDRDYIWTSHGCQINPWVYVGAGAGVNYWFDSESWSVPVFAHVRSEIHKLFRKNVSPYVDAKLGYSFADVEGVYFAPQVGCHFYFGHSKTGISVGIGYTLQNYKVESSYSGHHNSHNLNAGGVELTVALDI